jgi:inhibitor of cysteine peptidase
VVAALLAACGGEEGSGDGAKVLTGADSGSTVRTRVGEEIEVRLEANPSTGYAWSFPPVGGLIVATVEPPPPSPGASPTALGAPVTLVVKVKATAAGTYTLEGFYRRLWEPPPDAGPDFVLAVEARD